MLETEGIDHVALGVSDPAASAEWYQRVLGLERRYADVWDVPIMMGAGSTAVALFGPRDGSSDDAPPVDLGFRHLAFRVTGPNFEVAKTHLEDLGIAYEFQDHTVAHSIYFNDPDGIQIEITTYELG